MNWLSPGCIGGLLTLFTALSNAFGKPALGAFFSDPGTAASASSVLVGAGALVSGALAGIKPKA